MLNCIHADAQLGQNVKVGNFTTICEDVVIGDGCDIGNNVTIFPGARIGSGVKIFPGAVVAAVPQDLKFHGENSTVHIGGSNCLIMAYTHIAHDCRLGNNIIISNATQLAGEVVIDDNAVIGGGSLIHQFCHLGKGIMLQGGALVNKDIPPYVKAAREPISYVGLNSVGLHRRGVPQEDIDIISAVYRLIYLSDLNVTNAVKLVLDKVPACPIRDEIVDFVVNSERGIIRSAI